ncbi:MAG: hypothetical protein ACRDGR_06715 [bacterium]
MDPRHRRLIARRPAAAAAALALSVAPAPAFGWSVSVAPSGGVLLLDPALENYRWDISARPLWGLAATASRGRAEAGFRVWRSGTTQATGIPGETFAPDVGLTVAEVIGGWSVARGAGIALLASASAGMLHLGWSPDRATLDPFGVGSPVEVSFDPITEWTGGVGISARRGVAGGLGLALGVERSWFRLDTTHRAGDEIVGRRETFGQWIVRAELTHRVL